MGYAEQEAVTPKLLEQISSLQSENELLKKKLEKAIEQRDHYRSGFYKIISDGTREEDDKELEEIK